MQLNTNYEKAMMHTSARGFSLLEVLIASFIFGTGILGIAGLQLKSISMLSNSNSMSVAMLGANDMADRMRANPAGVADGYYDALDGTGYTDPSCGSTCTSSELAQLDAFTVNEQLSSELAEAKLTVVNTGNNVFTVEINWLERIGNNSETKVHRISFLPYNP